MDNPALFHGKRSVLWALCFITFALVFVYHTYPLGLSDFWWHLNTGRWIWSNGGLPADDPFLFSSPVPLDARASLILRGYPLSQLLTLAVYHIGGIQALVVLKGVLMTLFYGLLWNHLRRNGLHPLLALAVAGLVPLMFFRFDELRPQIFSFIFTLLVMQLVEHMLASEKQGKPPRWYTLAALPTIMLLWANLHRGFIIGVGILLVYLFSEWVAHRRGNNALSPDVLTPDVLTGASFRRFLIVTVVSAGMAFFNPAGITAMWASFTEVSGPFASVVDEFFGTVKYFGFYGMKWLGYLIVAVAAVPFLALLLKWRKLSLAHLILAASFLAAGILSFRFSLMMVAVVLAVASGYYAEGINRKLSAGKGIAIVLVWVVATGLLASAAFSRTSLAASPLETRVIPSGAVDYLARSGIAGNIYNAFEYGGYLSWRLYPRKIFIDPRNLSWEVYEEYSRAWRGDYDQVFGKYRIAAVVYPVLDMSSGRPSRLVAGLLGDKRWEVGYYDGRDIVFIRPDINGQLTMLDRQQVVNDVRLRLSGKMTR
jgi:hypothetical protein